MIMRLFVTYIQKGRLVNEILCFRIYYFRVCFVIETVTGKSRLMSVE